MQCSYHGKISGLAQALCEDWEFSVDLGSLLFICPYISTSAIKGAGLADCLLLCSREGCVLSWLESAGTLSGVKSGRDPCVQMRWKYPQFLPLPTTGTLEILSTEGCLKTMSPLECLLSASSWPHSVIWPLFGLPPFLHTGPSPQYHPTLPH